MTPKIKSQKFIKTHKELGKGMIAWLGPILYAALTSGGPEKVSNSLTANFFLQSTPADKTHRPTIFFIKGTRQSSARLSNRF
jgi:hypothetical protein